jgi:hypothetical protein
MITVLTVLITVLRDKLRGDYPSMDAGTLIVLIFLDILTSQTILIILLIRSIA